MALRGHQVLTTTNCNQSLAIAAQSFPILATIANETRVLLAGGGHPIRGTMPGAVSVLCSNNVIPDPVLMTISPVVNIPDKLVDGMPDSQITTVDNLVLMVETNPDINPRQLNAMIRPDNPEISELVGSMLTQIAQDQGRGIRGKKGVRLTRRERKSKKGCKGTKKGCKGKKGRGTKKKR